MAAGRHRVLEVAYVSAPQAALRDQVAAIYNRVGNVKNGERVEVLDREKRFARVRTGTGIEGWIEQRFLVDQKTFDALQKLTADNLNDPVQAPGVLRNDTNLHVTPGRDTEHLYQLASGAKVAILKRETAEKQTARRRYGQKAAKSGTKAPAGPALEDWWLVRDTQGRVGMGAGAHGRRRRSPGNRAIRRGSALCRLLCARTKCRTMTREYRSRFPQYLCLLTEPHDGEPYDFDQVRVFTWNARRHRYETAYREHGLNGVSARHQLRKRISTKKEPLPVFILRVKDDAGNVSERKYKLNTPIVRRVLAPGEVPTKPTKKRRR